RLSLVRRERRQAVRLRLSEETAQKLSRFGRTAGCETMQAGNNRFTPPHMPQPTRRVGGWRFAQQLPRQRKVIAGNAQALLEASLQRERAAMHMIAIEHGINRRDARRIGGQRKVEQESAIAGDAIARLDLAIATKERRPKR